MAEQIERDQITSLTADIVSAYVSNNPVPAGELASLIGDIHRSLTTLTTGKKESPAEPQKPAVPVKKSVYEDYIVCLEDGKKFKSLKRHLGVHYGLTPDEYRAKWNLPADYPMVAPAYAAARSALAKTMGLGRKKAEVPATAPASAKRGRRVGAKT
ncbi:MucR family transcriptional regulator [Mesorhizobium sp. J428]|uniref:MucR family transcriptional regulator n=1 Tax=Mesorhizobium sp. J428 TaxID=2898440 RepID=UPI0021511FCB|nr:MucR family transcriptional regulator [Mesorhizobium sp. J428]MCR5858294.1 MucR family transcriptional regulator [Mesorhizobium sp. J428]